jgi:hypothetical protein
MPTTESPVTTPRVPWATSTAEEHRFERHSLLSREDESPASGRAAAKGRSGTASPEQRRRDVAASSGDCPPERPPHATPDPAEWDESGAASIVTTSRSDGVRREPGSAASTPPPDRAPPGLDEIIAILARGVQRAIEAEAASPRAKSGH